LNREDDDVVHALFEDVRLVNCFQDTDITRMEAGVLGDYYCALNDFATDLAWEIKGGERRWGGRGASKITSQ